MSFADLIRQRVQAGLQSTESGGGPFLDVLHELAEGLTSDRIGAAITRGSVRGRYYLTLWPHTLPARCTEFGEPGIQESQEARHAPPRRLAQVASRWPTQGV